MRILVITDEIYPDAIGGVGKSLYNECVALVKRNHEVTVLVRGLKNLPLQSLVEGISIIRVFGPARGRWYYYLYPLAILYRMRQWLFKHKETYDVFYVHNPLYVIAIMLAGVRQRAPLVYTFHASIADEIHISAKRGKYGRLAFAARLVARVIGWMERYAFGQIDAMLPRSAYTLGCLLNNFPAARIPDRTHLIPLGVDNHHYKPQPKADARLQLNLPYDRPILITVRRLEGRMGLPNLIEAIKTVSRTYPDVLLLIAGKGYLRPTLETLIQDNDLGEQVRLLGFVSEEDLPFYLSASDAFILPTESYEGFGLATIEAMATGIPVIGTPIGATPEILTSIEPKLLTQDSSAEALATSIAYWLDHRSELATLGQRSRAAVEAHYNADQVAAQLETLFRTLKQDHETHH